MEASRQKQCVEAFHVYQVAMNMKVNPTLIVKDEKERLSFSKDEHLKEIWDHSFI